jgi:hypothetical protein
VETYREINSAGAPLKVQIITTRDAPIETILNGFYTTSVINIISWNKPYSKFPDTMINERKRYQLRSLDEYFGSLLAKDSRRDWTALEMAWEEDRRKLRSIETPCRRIGDSLSWKLSLDPTGVITGIPEIMLDYSCFEILKNDERYEDEEEQIQNPHDLIRAKAFISCILKYEFTFSRARSY